MRVPDYGGFPDPVGIGWGGALFAEEFRFNHHHEEIVHQSAHGDARAKGEAPR